VSFAGYYFTLACLERFVAGPQLYFRATVIVLEALGSDFVDSRDKSRSGDRPSHVYLPWSGSAVLYVEWMPLRGPTATAAVEQISIRPFCVSVARLVYYCGAGDYP
jgi:hypothetical protein